MWTSQPDFSCDGRTCQPTNSHCAVEYELTFVSDGDNDIRKAVATLGMPFPKCDIPVRSGFAFCGWFTDALDGRMVYSASGECLESVYTNIGPMVLVAKWERDLSDKNFGSSKFLVEGFPLAA